MARGDAVRVHMRVDETVMDGLISTGFFDKRDIGDYAVAFYIDWLKEK